MLASRWQVILWILSVSEVLTSCGPEDPTLHERLSPLRPARLDRQGRPILPIWATEQERLAALRAAPPPADDLKAAPAAGYRVPAEFEPTQAVVMTYTSYDYLLDEIAPYVASAGAEVWMVGGPASMSGVPAAQYRRLGWPYDSVWSRDYGPVGIDEASHALGIVDPTYRHYASRPDDDDIPCRVAAEAGATCHTTTLILDGGNYMTDGRGAVFLTRRIYDWNSQLSEAQVNQLLRDYLGAQSLHVFDYAADEYGDPADGTGHIDMFAKLLPGCVVLVVDTDDAPFAAVCDAAAATFAGLECLPGQNYQVLRVPGWYESDGWWGVWYTYTNSLIVNDTVLVPSYTGGQDAAARAVYQQALPGYTVALLNTDEPILSGGSIHCITKEIPRIEDLGCGTADDCDLPQVNQHSCTAGVCGIVSCDAGHGDCDEEPEDGCETNLWQLGACGTTCAGRIDCAAQVQHASGLTCAAGSCDYGACAALYGDCDGDRTNGCELDLRLDEAHCGGCLTSCAAGEVCEGGLCEVPACAEGRADCDGQPGNGCETALGTDTDCAGCGDDCRDLFAHAAGACVQGACAPGACAAGFGDCDGSPGNGCESELATDEAHCGDCPTACTAGQACEGGLCRHEPCPEGFLDCDGDAGNGCETPLGTDADCAGCGDDCRDLFAHGLGSCLAGACALGACEQGYADCDRDPASGCERSLGEVGTCGACNRACAEGQSCVRAGAGWTCQAGCTDGDGDGFASQACGGADCNDLAPGVNPDAAEQCNLADDDCDGAIDEDGVCDRQPDDSSGCGCAGAGGGPGAELGLLLLGLLCLGRRRRRGV